MADRWQSNNPEADEASENYNEWLLALALLLLAGTITTDEYEARLVAESGGQMLAALTMGSGLGVYNQFVPYLSEQNRIIKDSARKLAGDIAAVRLAALSPRGPPPRRAAPTGSVKRSLLEWPKVPPGCWSRCCTQPASRHASHHHDLVAPPRTVIDVLV